MFTRYSTLLLLFSLLLSSCGKKSGSKSEDPRPGTAVVAIMGDVDNFNPVVSAELIASQVNDAIFPQMFDVKFATGEGRLVYGPMLVKSWEFLNGQKDIRLDLRGDVYWEDGVRVTAEDIKFSYGLYGNPEVSSPRQNYVRNMIWTNGKFDVDKSIEIINDSTLIFHFDHTYPTQLFHLNLPPIPKHIFQNADLRTLDSNPANARPLSAGPFRLEKWIRQQEIILARNPKCNLPYPAKLQRVILRVISEPVTRLTELKKGTIDMMWPINPEDVQDLQLNYPSIRIETMPPRVYEYVGWANIDFKAWNESGRKVVKPHPLFGNKRVRQALTYGINRQEIIDGFLGGYGQLATSDISPIFRWAYNFDLKPYPYNPEKARNLLAMAGWTDTDGDGILDHNGRKFEFTLRYNAGNARRAYAANIIQDNLKKLGIIVKIEAVEGVVFYEKIARKEYDAFLAGFSVGLAIDPSDRWGSDIRNPMNHAGFMNTRVDELIRYGQNVKSYLEAAPFWKELQAILHEEQPFTFLYWIEEIVGINNRLQNTKVGILGAMNEMWNWTIGSPQGSVVY
ncbi:MAG: ABC transporter substrate-binding protein [Chlorobi bacterium]|nr:ABC transporter substrate-binding protein [Chlorobiota bacterium]